MFTKLKLCCNLYLLLGIGIGLCLASLLFILFPPQLSDYEIESMARERGMVYEHEVLNWQK